MRARLFCQRTVLPHEYRLGASNRRHIECESKMTCNAESSGMRDTLAIHQQQIGNLSNALERLQYNRRLSKGKQTWNIRHSEWLFRISYFHFLQTGKAQNDDRRACDTCAVVGGYVDARDEPHFAKPVNVLDTRRKLSLCVNGFGG